MRTGRRIRLGVVATATLALASAAHAASKREKVPLPKPRPTLQASSRLLSPAPIGVMPRAFTASVTASVPNAALAFTRHDPALPIAPTESTSRADLDAIKRAAALVERDRFSAASDVKGSIRDPLGRKLVEWMILRADPDHSAGFERYTAFVAENPVWPSVGLLRKRAEAALWDDRGEVATILHYFAQSPPLSGKGHLAYARALKARGDHRGAERHVREAWRNDGLSAGVESMVLDMFPGMLRPADHRARMHRSLYRRDVADALRAAQRLGSGDRAIAKAWIAVIRQAGNAKALLDAVPASARQDAGYIFALTRWLRRNDRIAEAARTILTAPRDAAEILDSDQWWIERRVLARDLLEKGDQANAYRVVRDAAGPSQDNYSVEQEFMAGWIALRFLKDPATALRHFTIIVAGTSNPTALARAGYWQGRAAEALGRTEDARGFYAAAARHRAAYYGQLARAKLGAPEIALPEPPIPVPERRAVLGRMELVRALEIIYAIGERDLAITFVAGATDKLHDVGAIVAIAEVARRHKDARAMLLIGKAALNRGFDLHHYAFPTIGVPDYKPIGPEIDPSLLYSIVRQESAFNAKTVSSASALGLMQVTPPAGQYIARKFGVRYDRKKLLNDMVYNVQMGAAELGDLIRDYRGSLILAFVGYNAGRGRVRDWIERFGDPRDPNVDPVDWVEKIPFSETRNYVQRIMENLQVYRAKLGLSHRLQIEADLQRGKDGH
jgi:soluble lytic murein transglycosylase